VSHLHSFRKRNAAALYEAHHGPNMTPMVDVVMVILIFFMASAAILGPEWFVPTRLPKAGAVREGEASEQPLKLHLRVLGDAEAGSASINGESPVKIEELGLALRGWIGQRPLGEVLVLIDPVERASYEDVVRVHAACAQAGLTKVGLGTPSQLVTGT
jgi:biopolymer transport protein ExbD